MSGRGTFNAELPPTEDILLGSSLSPARIEGNEPIIKTLVTILKEGLPTLITEINNAVADDFILEPPVNVLPYIPFDLTLEQGMPIVAVQDLPASYENDLIHSFEGEYNLAIASILQTSDHQTLAWQLRRYNQAVMQAIQNDRTARHGRPASYGSTGDVHGVRRDGARAAPG